MRPFVDDGFMDPMRCLVAAMPPHQRVAVAELYMAKLAPLAGSESVTSYLEAVCSGHLSPSELTNPARWSGLNLGRGSWLECLFGVWIDEFDLDVLDIDRLEEHGVALYGDLAVVAGASAAEAKVETTLVFDWEGSWSQLLDTARAAAGA